jgi:hypothetical protein
MFNLRLLLYYIDNFLATLKNPLIEGVRIPLRVKVRLLGSYTTSFLKFPSLSVASSYGQSQLLQEALKPFYNGSMHRV